VIVSSRQSRFGAFAAAAFASAALMLSRHVARAEESTPSCADPRVSVDGAVGSRWQDVVAALCTELGAMRDVDPSARLRLAAGDDDTLVVVASLGDGRTAERRVTSPSDLRATVEALVTLPPSAAPKDVEPKSTPAPGRQAAPEPTAADDRKRAAAQPPSVTIEIGASAVGRVWGTPTYVSAGANAYAGLRPGSWLFALLVRWDPLEDLTSVAPPGFEMESVGAGFAVAKRFGRGPSFDLGATASLVEEIQSMEDAGGETSGSQTDIRLGVVGRVLLGGGPFHGALSFEADASPGRFRRTVRIADVLPDLPSWSLGLGVGAAWDDR
jgi:hypothetical protein